MRRVESLPQMLNRMDREIAAARALVASAVAGHDHDGPRGVLGYAQATSHQTGITSETDLTGLSVTVAVGTERRIRVSGLVTTQADSGTPGVTNVRIREGATLLQLFRVRHTSLSEFLTTSGAAILTPSSGSHTYKLTMSAPASSSIRPAGDRPDFILVEDIGAA